MNILCKIFVHDSLKYCLNEERTFLCQKCYRCGTNLSMIKTVEDIFNDRAEMYAKSNKFRSEEAHIRNEYLKGDVLVVGCGTGRLLEKGDVGIDYQSFE